MRQIILRDGKGDVLTDNGVEYEADHNGVFHVPPEVAERLLKFRQTWTTPGDLADERAEEERAKTTLDSLNEDNKRLRAELHDLRAELKKATTKPRRATAAAKG